MKRFFRRRHCVLTVLFLIVSVAISSSTIAQSGTNVTAVNVYGVTTANQLIRFNSSTPGVVTTIGQITGLQSGENILGIDFRPATGELFGLGSTSRIYLIDKTTAAASSPRVLSTPLAGTSFGFDFNPTVDRIRIISNTGQNLRVDPATGIATVDGTLNAPGVLGADAAAYTNSFNGATATTLYVISPDTDILYTQNPPNAGTLVGVGPLGLDAATINGFDILSTESTALAALTSEGLTQLYTVNLSTGNASLVGVIASGTIQVRGLAIETAVITNFDVYGLTVANNLIRFNSGRANVILSSIAITGLQDGESLLGIDIRPATGELFGLGSTRRLYRINPLSGVATSVGTLTTPLSGTNFGFDFNPVPDRIRITSDADQNLRANPIDATNVVDGNLAYAVDDVNASANPNVVGSAYTNSVAGATATTLYAIDSNLGILAIQNPPNNGTLNTVGSLGARTTGEAGFDIAPGSNTALVAFQTPGTSQTVAASSSALYVVDLATGSAALVGPIGGGAVIRGLAIIGSGPGPGPGPGPNPVPRRMVPLDFNGDGRTDEVVFRPSNNTWYIRLPNEGFQTVMWGTATDVFTPGDYDGDRRTDVAVWRPENGTFYIIRSSDGGIITRQFGVFGDEPVARDYDGDGITDFAVVRRSGGVMTWYIQNSLTGFFRVQQFGIESDIVAPGDYDGDGRFDLAVRRGSGDDPATFFLQQSTAGFAIIPFGVGSDLVVPGDYDGDGRTDVSALRPGTTYTWFYIRSSNNSFNAIQLGRKPDYSVQGDYDGDGSTDVAVFDQINNTFLSYRSSNGALVQVVFGQNGDYPVANYDTH